MPKDPIRNLKFRLHLLRRCRAERKYRAAVRHMCETDLLFFVNALVWQFNPKSLGAGSAKTGPFVTWACQDRAVAEILAAIETPCDLVIEKSRDMGASWLCLIVMLWFWLFKRDMKFLCVSRNADAVDLPGRVALVTMTSPSFRPSTTAVLIPSVMPSFTLTGSKVAVCGSEPASR